MSYSIEIYKISKVGNTYSATQENYSFGQTTIPDEYIRSVKIDDASIDSVDLFAVIGRKCNLLLTAWTHQGWFTHYSHSANSHPDYSDWFPFIWVIRRNSAIIFIGALKRTNYQIDEEQYTEKLVLSDALDVYIDIIKNNNMTTFVNEDGSYNLIDMVDTISSTMNKWPMMNSVSLSSYINYSYYINQLRINYPGYNVADYTRMQDDAQYNFGFLPHVNVWLNDDNEVQVVFWIIHRDEGIWRSQGYIMWFSVADPFNIPRPAEYLNGNRNGFTGSSIADVLGAMVYYGVLPYFNPPSVDTYSDGNITVFAPYNTIFVTGYYYPQSQTFSDSEVNTKDLIKTMLVTNFANIQATPYETPGEINTLLLITSKINPEINLIPGSNPINKYFTSDEMTFYTKTGIQANTRMLDSLDALNDSELKKTLMSELYSQSLSKFKYSVTFGAHNTVTGVSSLVIGDIVQLSGIPGGGNYVIVGISDEDNNGIITFTVVGGY